MKKGHLRTFAHRGLLFGGFGSIIVSLILLIISRYDTVNLTAGAFFRATVSGYLLAFVVAGCGVFYQIETWSLAKATLLHAACLYGAYLGCYLVNSWIPGDPASLGIFTAVFAGGYFLIWLIIMVTVRATAKKLNEKIGIKQLGQE